MFGKKIFRFVVIAIIITVFFGCSRQGKTYIEPNEVEWISVGGGGYAGGNINILFKSQSQEKVDKILRLINDGRNRRYSTLDEIEVAHYMHITHLHIRLWDGKDYFIYPAGKVIKKKFKNGVSESVEPYMDRFIMEVDGKLGGDGKYITIYSNEFVDWLRNDRKNDIPSVEQYKVEPSKLKIGEKIKMSGGGAIDKEVSIIITNNSGKKYIVAKSATNNGEWEWEGVIEKDFITHDGNRVSLKEKFYQIGVQFGEQGTITQNLNLQ